ncbi:hypothetical protein [Arcticibacter sp. MXS-1]|uniref:hypothetical protein n=1 Tax=Arcticibacter sp. MXS-1 TaxID=3341726 RepID=UPI0035A94EC7
MYGQELKDSLQHLIEHFEEEAVPDYGRYVKEPARANKNGVQYIPRRVANPRVLAGIAIVGALTALSLVWGIKKTLQG